VVWFELELALVDRGGGAWSDCATEVPAPSVSTSRETLALLK
jgi:hypothetical protein